MDWRQRRGQRARANALADVVARQAAEVAKAIVRRDRGEGTVDVRDQPQQYGPEPFRSSAMLPDGAVKVLFRAYEDGDRNFVLGSWSAGWRQAPECRNLRDGRYARLFQDAVVGGYGALQAEGTKVLVGASPSDRKWIWAFCVFTTYPGEAPVIHWLHVRPTLRDGRKTMSLRRLGVATRMLGTGGDLGPGVTDRLVYTCRPGAPTARECQALEADLLEGCKKIGVTAAHFPLERWLTP